jgi:cytochrome c556
MRKWSARSGVLAVSVVLAVGCTTGQSSRMDTKEAIAARQQLMKEQGAAMRSIQDKVKAGQVQAIAVDAETLIQTSKRIPVLFPEGSLDPETSRAKPEIWQKRSEFEGYAKTLETKAAQLTATAGTGNAQATGAAVADLGKTTCGACHTAFRGPEIKK